MTRSITFDDRRLPLRILRRSSHRGAARAPVARCGWNCGEGQAHLPGRLVHVRRTRRRAVTHLRLVAAARDRLPAHRSRRHVHVSWTGCREAVARLRQIAATRHRPAADRSARRGDAVRALCMDSIAERVGIARARASPDVAALRGSCRAECESRSTAKDKDDDECKDNEYSGQPHCAQLSSQRFTSRARSSARLDFIESKNCHFECSGCSDCSGCSGCSGWALDCRIDRTGFTS
jgi:hypothetical protein